MSEKYRQCAKCGVKGGENLEISLHRFPSLGKKSIERIRARAVFCYPNEDWMSEESLDKLCKQHKLLCSKHFSVVAYSTHRAKKRLTKYAIPMETPNLLGPGPSTCGDFSNDQLWFNWFQSIKTSNLFVLCKFLKFYNYIS